MTSKKNSFESARRDGNATKRRKVLQPLSLRFENKPVNWMKDLPEETTDVMDVQLDQPTAPETVTGTA